MSWSTPERSMKASLWDKTEPTNISISHKTARFSRVLVATQQEVHLSAVAVKELSAWWS